MLSVSALDVYYGDSHALRGVSFELAAGEAVAVMGRNGMGKTTLLNALIGLLPARGGKVVFDGHELKNARSYRRVALGMGFVPQGRMIFPNLTVEENVLTGMENAADRTVPAWIYETFPVLAEMRARKGGNLSGGQQQQLAIARALASNPKLLILDEPTEGVQPSIIKDIARTLNRLKRERGFALLVSEQVLSFAMEVADRFLIIEKGEIVHEEQGGATDTEKIRAYLTV